MTALPEAPDHRHPRRSGPLLARTLLPLVAWALTWPLAVPGQLYRYVDENGVTVYSQTPPAAGEAMTITPDPEPSSDDVNAAIKRLNDQWVSMQKRQAAAREQAKQKEAEAANADIRRTNCRAARTNLQTLNNLGARWLTLPDGQTVAPNSQQRQRLRDDARSQIDEFCD